MFKTSRKCACNGYRTSDALVNSCFTEAFLLVPKCADAVPNHLKKCGGNDWQLVRIVSCYLLSVALRLRSLLKSRPTLLRGGVALQVAFLASNVISVPVHWPYNCT